MRTIPLTLDIMQGDELVYRCESWTVPRVGDVLYLHKTGAFAVREVRFYLDKIVPCHRVMLRVEKQP